MKRFFCTICNRVKRVRQYPNDVVSSTSGTVVNRVGTCARHSAPSNQSIKQTVTINQSKKRA